MKEAMSWRRGLSRGALLESPEPPACLGLEPKFSAWQSSVLQGLIPGGRPGLSRPQLSWACWDGPLLGTPSPSSSPASLPWVLGDSALGSLLRICHQSPCRAASGPWWTGPCSLKTELFLFSGTQHSLWPSAQAPGGDRKRKAPRTRESDTWKLEVAVLLPCHLGKETVGGVTYKWCSGRGWVTPTPAGV